MSGVLALLICIALILAGHGASVLAVEHGWAARRAVSTAFRVAAFVLIGCAVLAGRLV